MVPLRHVTLALDHYQLRSAQPLASVFWCSSTCPRTFSFNRASLIGLFVRLGGVAGGLEALESAIDTVRGFCASADRVEVDVLFR